MGKALGKSEKALKEATTAKEQAVIMQKDNASLKTELHELVSEEFKRINLKIRQESETV